MRPHTRIDNSHPVSYALADYQKTLEDIVATLFVTSTQPLSGKTALCASLGGRFLSQGLRVGYLKPLATQVRQVDGKAVDEDVLFLRELLDLAQTWDVLSPIILTHQEVEAIMGGGGESSPGTLKAALTVAEQGRDVLLLEGTGRPQIGSVVGLSARSIAQMSGAKTLLVARYEGPDTADEVLGVAAGLSPGLLGVVINQVPPEAQEFASKTLAPFLGSRGVPVLGLLPQERALLGLTVGELAECLDGELLRGADKRDDLVEGFLLGALSTDYMQDYYTRRRNVAVITSGERTDIQLFSMTPNTRCVILTGYRRPTELVLAQAAEHGIPVVLVKEDTLTVAERVEGLFASSRFHQRRKLPIMAGVLEAAFDFPALYEGLGLKVKA